MFGRPLSRPPGPAGRLIVGVYPEFLKNPAEYLLRLSREWGDIVYFRLGPQHMYLLNRPDYIQDVLVTNAGNFVKSRILQRAKVLLGEGLLTSEGAFHLRQRRLVQPAFYRDRLVGYARTMVECADEVQAQWRDGETLDVAGEMMRLTLAIVSRTLFGSSVHEDARSISEALTAVLNTFNTLVLPFSSALELLPLRSVKRAEEAREYLDDTILRMIESRRKDGQDRGDLLSMLLAAVDDQGQGARMTNQQVRDEAMTLFLAGHETTAVALTWALYLLSQHEEAAAKAEREVDELLGGRSAGFDDVRSLVYTDMVFAETMRLYPPAWAISRMTVNYARIFNYEVPAGSVCLMSPYAMHRHKRYWTDPEKFDPERWHPEMVEARPKFSYFPFGGGVRQCIGERFAWTEGILVLATLLQRWRFRLATGFKPEIRPQITLRPRDGMQMVIGQRRLK